MGAFLVLIRFSDPAGQELGTLEPLATWLQKHRFVLACVLLGAELCLQVLRWLLNKFGPRIDVLRVQQILNSAVERLFDEQNLEHYVYRATLFQAKGSWVTGRWLGAVARSGHMYRRLRTVFSIDSENAANNTGFAGECWRRNGETIISAAALPDEETPNLSVRDRAAYRKQGYLSAVEYNAMSVRSRVFLATGIRIRGALWGVLVLDTTDPAMQPGSSQMRTKRQKALDYAAVSLSVLLRSHFTTVQSR
jgi:hypothetical protein